MHEKLMETDPDQMPNTDIRLTEEFLEERRPLVGLISQFVLAGALASKESNDNDVREALDAMIKTYRTRQSGLVYETRPVNAIAGEVQQSISGKIGELEQALAKEHGGTRNLRDADVLGVLVFIQRLGFRLNNGRPRGRTFIYYLIMRYALPEMQKAKTGPVAEAPLIVS